MQNPQGLIISLGQWCRWLAQQAEQLGVDIFTGFAATELLYEQNKVVGVATGEMGRNANGEPGDQFQAGVELHGTYTLMAEGCRGYLSEQLIQKFNLRANVCPQTYGIGFKEVWRIPAAQHQPGLVIHTIGWPLDSKTYGGSFLYHAADQKVALGFVIGLDYCNPYLNPYQEFQRWKCHPTIRAHLAGGNRLSYGARALNEGGWQAVPQLTVPGAMLIGCAAGFMNVPRIKGTHTAMKSALLAAELCAESILKQTTLPSNALNKAIEQSWIAKELKRVRNVRPAFKAGLWVGLSYSALDQYLIRGHAPWTFCWQQSDHEHLDHASQHPPIHYPKADNKFSFDLMTSVRLSNTHHRDNQPCHLQLQDPNKALTINAKEFASLECRYCPAGVYEIVAEDPPRLQINAQNCLHCKTCDIKDPTQNIRWLPPEGSGGPNYEEM